MFSELGYRPLDFGPVSSDGDPRREMRAMLDTHARQYVQPVIRRTAQGCLRLGLTPNQVTWSAFIIGMGAAAVEVGSRPVAAVILLWLSAYLDAVDGSMARERHQTSPWGTLLDITFDRLVELGIIVALAIRFPDARLLLVLLTAGIVFSMTVFLTVGALAEKQGMKSFYYQAGLAERTEGIILLSVMMLWSGALLWTTAAFVVVEIVTAVQRLREAYRLFEGTSPP